MVFFFNIEIDNSAYISNQNFSTNEQPKKKNFFNKVGNFFEKTATQVSAKIKDINIKEKAQFVANKGKEVIVNIINIEFGYCSKPCFKDKEYTGNQKRRQGQS
jgi:hypothetical protein